MKKIVKYPAPCLLLIVFWLVNILFDNISPDGLFIRSAVSYALFPVAAVLSRALPNRHAAFISASLTGVIFCIVQPSAVFDALPALLLCCWLRCYLEKRKNNNVALYFELFTDLIYASLIAAAVRLFKNGYAFMYVTPTDKKTIRDIILTFLVLLFFIVLFIFVKDKTEHTGGRGNNKKQKNRRDRGVVGLIPVFPTLRTFWGLCAVTLAAALLQYTDYNLVDETVVFARGGMRFMFLPWMALLFIVLDVLFPDTAESKGTDVG